MMQMENVALDLHITEMMYGALESSCSGQRYLMTTTLPGYLLANSGVHNFIRKISWEIHQKYRTGTRHAALPPYISLKQPFGVSDLPALEKYMDELAGSIQPFDVTLTELQAVPTFYDGVEYGILWVEVEETEMLRNLHNRVNRDLNLRFGDTPADFDGHAYRFHMTVMMCGQLMEICRKYQSDIQHSKVNLRYYGHGTGNVRLR